MFLNKNLFALEGMGIPAEKPVFIPLAAAMLPGQNWNKVRLYEKSGTTYTLLAEDPGASTSLANLENKKLHMKRLFHVR